MSSGYDIQSELSLRSQVAGKYYAVSRWGSVQPLSSIDLIFLLFPNKIAGDHAHSSRGKSPAPGPRPPALGDSPDLYSTNNILTVDYNNEFKYNQSPPLTLYLPTVAFS